MLFLLKQHLELVLATIRYNSLEEFNCSVMEGAAREAEDNKAG